MHFQHTIRSAAVLSLLLVICTSVSAEVRTDRLLSRPTDSLSGERFRYIDDSETQPKISGSTVRSFIYANGGAAVMTRNSSAFYISSDSRSSVRSMTDSQGQLLGTVSYSPFGEPVSQLTDAGIRAGFAEDGRDICTLAAGFGGKQYDQSTGLYDFGFRDYSPAAARFTTADPIRSGRNWYSYAGNDPVNYVDLYGLTQYPILSGFLMNKGPWAEIDLNGGFKGDEERKKETIGNSGCAATTMSNVLYTIHDLLPDAPVLEPDLMNAKYVKDGYMQWQDLAADYGIGFESVQGQFTKEIWDAQCADEQYAYMTVVQLKWSDTKSSDHFVGVKDVVVKQTEEGSKEYLVIAPSSENDSYVVEGSHRGNVGWIEENGEILVPVEDVKGYRNFYVKEK